PGAGADDDAEQREVDETDGDGAMANVESPLDEADERKHEVGEEDRERQEQQQVAEDVDQPEDAGNRQRRPDHAQGARVEAEHPSGPSGPAVAPTAAGPVATPRPGDHQTGQRENRDERGADDEDGRDGQPQHAALDTVTLERADGRRRRVALRAARADLLRVRLST